MKELPEIPGVAVFDAATMMRQIQCAALECVPHADNWPTPAREDLNALLALGERTDAAALFRAGQLYERITRTMKSPRVRYQFDGGSHAIPLFELGESLRRQEHALLDSADQELRVEKEKPRTRGQKSGESRRAERERITRILAGYRAAGIPPKAMPDLLMEEHGISRKRSAINEMLNEMPKE